MLSSFCDFEIDFYYRITMLSSCDSCVFDMHISVYQNLHARS